MSRTIAIVGIATAALGLTAFFTYPAFGQVPPARITAPTIPQSTAPVYVCRSSSADNGVNQSETINMYSVPAGKRLVIETISGWMSIAPGTSVMGYVSTKVGGQTAVTSCVFEPQGTDGGPPRFAFTHQVRLYAEAGSMVNFTMRRTDRTRTGSKTMSFTGYLEPAN